MEWSSAGWVGMEEKLFGARTSEDGKEICGDGWDACNFCPRAGI